MIATNKEELITLQRFLVLEETGVMDKSTAEALDLFGTHHVELHWDWTQLVRPSNWEMVWNYVPTQATT